MYATCLQFDVLFPLKEITNNYNLRFSDANKITDESILKDFFRIIIRYSIQGVFGDKPYLDMKNKKEKRNFYNPIDFAITWVDNIFSEKRIEKIFHNVMEEYYTITKWERNHPYYNNFRIWESSTIESFNKYTLFDAEEMYQKGVLNKDKFFDRFHSHIHKYHLVNDGVITKTFDYYELYELLKDKFEYCVCPHNGYLIVDYFDRNNCDNTFRGIIVVDSYFGNIKTIDGYLEEQEWENFEPWQVEQLGNRFGYNKLAKYSKPYLDKCNSSKVDVWLMIEKIKQNDYNISDLTKWIGAFFKTAYCFDRNVLESAIKMELNDEQKQIVKNIYMNYMNNYLGD